jgi:hypothetical protein
MAGDEEPDEFDFEEWKQKNKERRRERREQATYEWVETVREAGELYRNHEDIEEVSDELNLSEKNTREALTVYQLIFEDPPGRVAAKTSAPGRAYFSLEEDADSAVDEYEDEDEPVEELLREFVGSIYIEHDLDEHSVDDPPERSTPPMAVDFSELSDILSHNYSFSMQSIIPGSGLATIPNIIRENQASRMAKMMQPVMEHRTSSVQRIAESIAAHQREMMQSMISTSFPPLARQLQRHQDILNTSIANSVTGISFPEPVLADLANLQTGFSAAAATGATPTSPDTEDSVTTEVSTATVEAETSEATATTAPPTAPTHVTVDATLPDPDAFTTELVFEIPMMVTKAILSTGQARTWYDNLHEDYQIDVVKVLLAGIAVFLTQNPAWAGIAAMPARSLRRIILNQEEDKE